MDAVKFMENLSARKELRAKRAGLWQELKANSAEIERQYKWRGGYGEISSVKKLEKRNEMIRAEMHMIMDEIKSLMG